MRNYRFGKHPAKHDYRTLFQKLHHSGLAAPPRSFNVFTNVNQKLKTSNPTTLSPWMGMTRSAIAIADLAHATTV